MQVRMVKIGYNVQTVSQGETSLAPPTAPLTQTTPNLRYEGVMDWSICRGMPVLCYHSVYSAGELM